MTLCRLLGIKKPLVQAPMAGVQNWRLAAAVSAAGGLGSIPCGMLGAAQIADEIARYQACTLQPYNLNFFCHAMPAIDEAQLTQWQACLAPYYEDMGVSPPADLGVLRRPYDAEIAEVLSQYKPPVISFHFGLPEAALVKQIKSWGSLILSSATTLDEALFLQKHGADIIIAQGLEAGGHRAMFLRNDTEGQAKTADLMALLLPQLSLPIIAAGGIGSAATVQQLLMQGAAGVQIGTAYLLCDEADTSAVHKAALQDKQADTALTNVFSGRLARGIRNRMMQNLGPIHAEAPDFPYAASASSPLRRAAEARGLGDFTPLWSGENRAACQAISAADMTLALCSADS